MMRLLPTALLSLILFFAAVSVSAGRLQSLGPSVLPCAGVTLTASYLAEAVPGTGPGFLFRIQNSTPREIRLEQPVPSSAHWYALVGNRWLWRASAGRGGTLVDAERERGPMFASRPSVRPAHPAYLTIPAHASKQWSEPMRDNPAIEYRPSCPMCNYPGEREYEAIFAYAYLPNPFEDARDLLRCGLRSAPVPMPPVAVHPPAPAPLSR